jgi:3'-phosphoadenosine 5'-phosphosulfate sulfotransferase
MDNIRKVYDLTIIQLAYMKMKIRNDKVLEIFENISKNRPWADLAGSFQRG